MSSFTPDIDYYSTDRSPNSMRGYAGVQRQSSRYFDNPAYVGPQQGLYTAEEHHSHRYEPAPQDFRVPVSTLQLHGAHYPPNMGYDSQTWSFGSGANTIGGTGRVKQNPRRGAIPTWDQPVQPTAPFDMPVSNEGMYQLPQVHRVNQHSPEPEPIIQTAIVIKNIPFAIKKEQLQERMVAMGLPLPYAFNYHFDNGVFRGLAFANFQSPADTSAVIAGMNQLEVGGRKLRVEYKKELPRAERERIENAKRERRGQLQEQHQPMNNGQLHNQGSMNSLSSNIPATSPSPVSQRDGKPTQIFRDFIHSAPNLPEMDLNDPTTLHYYTELMIFKNDPNRETLIFPSDVTPADRRTIHTLAHHMNLEHKSEGLGEHRQVQILKKSLNVNPIPQINSGYYNESRRGLNRAATVDFTERRELDSNHNDISLRRQGSYLLDVPTSPGTGLAASHNLRGAKSFADLRSFSPSPVPSTSSFPTNLAQNANRYAENYYGTNTSGTPNLTPTSAGGMNSRDDLSSGMAGLGIREDRSVTVRPSYTASAGPIGSQRPINGSYDESPRNGSSGAPQRQPKGPSVRDWEPQGFTRPRQNGHINRGSDSSDRSAPTRYM